MKGAQYSIERIFLLSHLTRTAGVAVDRECRGTEEFAESNANRGRAQRFQIKCGHPPPVKYLLLCSF